MSEIVNYSEADMFVKTALRAVQGLSDPDTHRNPLRLHLEFGRRS